MELSDARILAESLLSRYGLDAKGWTFDFDNAKKRLGLCNFTKKKITISKYMTSASDEEVVRQVLLHEVAHAMLPPYAKHGEMWKNLSKHIGYTGERTLDNAYVTKNKLNAIALVSKVNPSPTIDKGDIVRLPNGTVLTILGLARKRFHAVADSGQKYAIPPSALTVDAML